LELDYREAQDQGYKFHFSWILILIVVIAWVMPEGATFSDIDPFEPLAVKFTLLWYSSDMGKTVAFKRSLSYILSPTKEGYRS
jgi:hypothetical protein